MNSTILYFCQTTIVWRGSMCQTTNTLICFKKNQPSRVLVGLCFGTHEEYGFCRVKSSPRRWITSWKCPLPEGFPRLIIKLAMLKSPMRDVLFSSFTSFCFLFFFSTFGHNAVQTPCQLQLAFRQRWVKFMGYVPLVSKSEVASKRCYTSVFSI